MYTRIIDENKLSWQFRTGMDQCETYNLGAAIPEEHFYISRFEPGEMHLADGIYDAMSDEGSEAWLVISQGIFKELVPYVHGENGIEPSELSLFKKWDIHLPDPDLWTEKQWAEKAKRDWKAAWEKQCLEAEMENMNPIEKSVFLSRRSMRRQLSEKGFMRQILPTEPTE